LLAKAVVAKRIARRARDARGRIISGGMFVRFEGIGVATQRVANTTGSSRTDNGHAGYDIRYTSGKYA
jgi:hypothetical protein